MSITSPADLTGLRSVARVVRLTLDALQRHVRAGVSTAELDRRAGAILAEHGARSAPAAVYGFPGHVLISVNDEIVHGVPGPRLLVRGDLIEPMISAGSDEPVPDRNGWTIRTRDGSLAAHHEHTLVITRHEPIVLTAA